VTANSVPVSGPPASKSAAYSALPGPEALGSQLRPVQELHRHKDGVVTFHRKTADDRFENVCAIRAEYLESLFPKYRKLLEADAYFSLNAFWDTDTRPRRLSALRLRRHERLRYLCAAYVDLDIYNKGLDFRKALREVIAKTKAGSIPPPSAVLNSGRGMWLLWFLRDKKMPGTPVRAFPEKIRLYANINRAAGVRLADLGTDAGACDATRIMRVPGSINRKAPKQRVKYWHLLDQDGSVRTYTLSELADCFDLRPQTAEKQPQQASSGASQLLAGRKRGHTQLNARRLREFELLRQIRGGFMKGRRNSAALLYAWLLTRSGMEQQAVVTHVAKLAHECHPPLDASAQRGAVKTAFARTMRRMTDQRISDLLDITPAEAEHLEKLPAASQFRAKKVPAAVEYHTAEERRHVMAELLSKLTYKPSLREMARKLAAKGYPLSHTQVARDYLHLSASAVL